METRVLRENGIDEAVRLLKAGEVVAVPTETVYGLGADARNARAVEKVFEAKGRPSDNPLIVHIASMDMLKGVAVSVPDVAYKLFARFSPGPLTVVLKKAGGIPAITTGGLSTVGVRIPNHPLTLKLIERANIPLAAPSANTSGHVSPTKAVHVHDDLDGKIPLILDGGECTVGVESTIVDLTTKPPRILRAGGITEKELRIILPDVVVGKVDDGKALAPGMKYAHYRPRCEAKLVRNIEEAVAVANDSGEATYILGEKSFFMGKSVAMATVLGENATECQKNLYGMLRMLEKKAKLILIQEFAECAENRALINRIQKATGGEYARK